LNPKAQTLYAVGKLVKAFGIKGEAVVLPMTENPARFQKLKQVLVGKGEAEAKKLPVEYVRVDARGVRIKFAGVPDRTSVEPLIGSLLFVDSNHRVTPAKGSYFIHDVIGLRVVDADNRECGVVKDVLRLPAQDLYVIHRNGTEWLLPAVKEFIGKIDVAAGILHVQLIDGMMEP
jgi:16S rRNA processing protein RimM